MVRGMLAFAWVVAQLVAPAVACTGPDIAITQVKYAIVRGTQTIPDRIVLTADVVNVGTQSQSAGVTQHVELLHDGMVLASERFRPLRVGERYPVALRLFRTHEQRKDPLEVVVRYVPDDRHARGENCNPSNDSVQKIF
jgi:hypothetical protein